MFAIGTAWSYILGVGPPAIYLFLCFVVKADTQVYIAYISTGIYAVVMMGVLVGTIIEIATKGVLSAAGIFLFCKYSKFSSSKACVIG